MGEDTPYFDGCLPIEVMAERGARDAALRADEAGRPHQSARPGASPMPSSSCARTMRSARSTTWSASRPSSNMPSRSAIFRTIPGLEKAEFARLGGLHRNTFLNSPELLDGAAAAEGRAAAALRRPDHRLRRLCRKRRDRAARRALRRGRAAGRDASSRRRRPRRSARCSTTSPAANRGVDAGPRRSSR